MSNSNTFWFHCGRCGSLFLSHAGYLDDRLCAKCGFNPSLGLAEPSTPAAPPTQENLVTAGHPGQKGKKMARAGKNGHLMFKIIAGWTLVLTVIVLVARFLCNEEVPANAVAAPATVAPEVDAVDIDFMEKEGPKCSREFSAFLAAVTPEEQNQFVLSAVTTASRMARYYNSNPLIKIDASGMRLSKQTPLNLPDGKALETLWHATNGRVIEAVFRGENGDWKLDWEHYIRYSDAPWALFLAGGGVDEGEFRLLARERLAEERKNAETISLVLYAPRFGNPGDVGFQSPEFLVSRRSPDGKLLDAAFKMEKSGAKVFGSRLPCLNPEGMIRVRVKVRRTEVERERQFEITKVVACHWYSLDHPGVVPEGDTPPEPTPAVKTAPDPQPH